MTNKQAYALMQQEVWCTCGGYTWRNRTNVVEGKTWGEYLTYGNYPASIRSGNPTTYNNVKSIAKNSSRGWCRWDPDVKLVIDLWDFILDD